MDREKDIHLEILASMAERTIKRLWVIIILLVVVLVATNGAWIYYESQFVTEEWTVDAYADGDSNAIANGDGEVYFYGGESTGNTSAENP